MRKRLNWFMILILLILAGIYLMQRVHLLPSLSDIFKSQPVEIDNSILLIKEINSLAQLITITAYNEITIDSTKKGWSLFNNPLIPSLLNIPNIKKPDEKLILIGRGRILAGINLAKLTQSDLFVKNDSVSVIIPSAEILQVILNPSGFEIFEERGNWTDDEVKAVKIKLREKLVATALRQNILQKATDRVVLIMEHFLKAMGFKKVTLILQT
ncbi:MAG: DUF4230 domain-containing protein [Ferruginibacter sp.]|nr:DUF4230 domain-containing protein [Ferruginibacter sp.]